MLYIKSIWIKMSEVTSYDYDKGDIIIQLNRQIITFLSYNEMIYHDIVYYTNTESFHLFKYIRVC